MPRLTAEETYALLGDALAGRGTAVVLRRPLAAPLVELLLPARGPESALLDALPWRWRFGGHGIWRLVRRVAYVFDGGTVLLAHRSLGPRAARLEAGLRRAAGGRRGLIQLSPSHELVYAAAEARRAGAPPRAVQAQLEPLLDDQTVREAQAVAARTRLGPVLEEALGSARGEAPAGRSGRAGRRPLARRFPHLAALLHGRPLQHAPARCRFLDLELVVGPGVFLPRGASEQLVHSTLPLLHGGLGRIAVDVGTGCGAVALSLARSLPDARVLGIDTDERAVGWARRNARRLGLDATFAAGSLLEPLPPDLRGNVSVVTANIPCVPSAEFSGAGDAPASAYVGAGPDGLGLQRRLADQARSALRPGGHLVLQLAPSQWAGFAGELAGLGYEPGGADGEGVAVVGTARWPGARS
jgi:release factor glutamine methyltransferase